MFSHLEEDLRRYFILSRQPTLFQKLKIIILTQGIWALCIYRMGAWCVTASGKFPLVRWCLPFLTVFQKLIEITTGISIPFNTRIGKGFYIGHFGSIIIGSDVQIGDYCNISQEVTIGLGGRGGNQHSPIIGNRVYIGPGAKIFGDIKIGDNSAIGANAVVLHDVPENAVVGGVPAKILNYKGSSDFIITGDTL